MNSILHTCTHSNDDTLVRMTEDQMYAAIFTYIEHLFEIIKPNKVFYMAIDGVAPRAKMNQQRARRFRTAYEAELNLKKAIQDGAEIPKEDPFDSNAITPGTEFMAKLTDNLKYFIHKKITEDSRWANVQIILSGHEVPGEGEHKIMEYIRTMKNQPDADPNLRHCIYGLDADLIMLGLVSHYPHFALLREEVTFGPRSQKKSSDINDQKFYLLHLSLLREYLSLEFRDLDTELNFEYNFERVLDDFILIMYVIGNDFLPNLPDLHLNKGAFPLILETFKQALRQCDGYLNENGTINLKRLDIWLHILSEFELENFEKQDIDVEWFNKRLEDISITGEKRRERMGKLLILKDQKKLVGMIKPWLLEICNTKISDLIKLANEDKLPTLELPREELEKHIEFLKMFALDVGILIVHSRSKDTYEVRLDVDGTPPDESDEEHEERLANIRKIIKRYQSANLVETEDLLKESKDVYDSKFMNWKDQYYKEKVHFSINDKENLVDMTQNYVEGLQWVLYYYYKGCPSWNWFYRYHYAPRISDIHVGVEEYVKTNHKIKFEKSTPFKPFEQLMAVLPARSRKLMPIVYRQLMTDPASPLIDFYPAEVDIDMNGKKASWEAVVLLSFVDEKRLLDALKPFEQKLTIEEKRRNSFGTDLRFIFNPQIDHVYPSPLPGFFHDIEHDKCYEDPFILPEVKGEIKIELGEGALLGKYSLAGFPTLDTIPFDYELKLHDIKIFQSPSKSVSMILTLKNIWEDLSVHQFSQKFLGKIVYSRWPFLRESRVVSVSDKESRYELVKTQNSRKFVATPLSPEEIKAYNQLASSLKETYDRTKGITLKEITGLVSVQPVTGLIRNERGAYVKTFSKEVAVYPLQLIVEEVLNQDARYASRPPQPIEEEFPLGSNVVFLGAFAYGTPASVAGYTDDTKVNVKISKIPSSSEPNIGKKRLEIEKKEIVYVPSYDVAKRLKLNSLFLSKITSGFMVENDYDNNRRVNIGLELKFEGRRQKVLGFTRKGGKAWEFSPLAIQLIRDYQSKFPDVFKELQEFKLSSMPKASVIFKSHDKLKEVSKWVKEVKLQLITVSLESESLTKFSYAAIENYIEQYVSQTPPFSSKDIKGVPRNAILDPAESYQLLSTQRFELGDRVLYVQDSGKVPYLSKGTIVGITTLGTKTSLSVIFDHPLMSGNTMNGKLKSKRGLVVDSSLVLNLTNKQLVYHSKASKERAQKQPSPEKKQRAKEIALAKKKKEEEERKKANAEKTNELLDLLKKGGNKTNDQQKPEGSGEKGTDILHLLKKNVKDAKEDTNEDTPVNASAIKQIYGQIYSHVMNEGVVPPPAPHYIPAVPGIPLPPQFLGQAHQPPPAQQGFPAPVYGQPPQGPVGQTQHGKRNAPANFKQKPAGGKTHQNRDKPAGKNSRAGPEDRRKNGNGSRPDREKQPGAKSDGKPAGRRPAESKSQQKGHKDSATNKAKTHVNGSDGGTAASA